MVSMKPSESENKAEPAGFRSEIDILAILKFPLKKWFWVESAILPVPFLNFYMKFGQFNPVETSFPDIPAVIMSFF